MVKDEVNPIDFIGIETIHMVFPEIHELMINSKESLVGTIRQEDASGLSAIRERLNALTNFADSGSRDSVQRLLVRLFPKLRASLENYFYPPGYLEVWNRSLCVCHPARFDVYFRLSVPTTVVSEREFKKLMQMVNDSSSFHRGIYDLVKRVSSTGVSAYPSFLNRLMSEELDATETKAIIDAFFMCGDRFYRPEDEGLGFFSPDLQFRMCWIIAKSSKQVVEESRFSLISGSIENGKALSLIVRFALALEDEADQKGPRPVPEAEWVLNSGHRTMLAKLICEKIQQSSIGALLNSPHLPMILYYWQRHGDKGLLQSRISEISQNEDNVPSLMEGFLVHSTQQSIEDAAIRVTYRIEIEALKHFIDPTTLVAVARAQNKRTNLTKRQQIALSAFLSDFEDAPISTKQ